MVPVYNYTTLNESWEMEMHIKNSGFTLIELMIVVAIIGILAAVAIPSYQDYTGRAQVTEGLNLTSSFKTPLTEWLTQNSSLPTTAELAGTTSGKYVASVVLGGTSTIPTITATFRSSGLNANIASQSLTLTSPDRGLTWNCSSTIDSKFLPKACK